jgi:hypothetical protein
MVFFYMVLLEYHVVGLVWCGAVIVSRVKILGSNFFWTGYFGSAVYCCRGGGSGAG